MNNITPELSVLIPCLNEADTLEVCITKAQKAISGANINAEIILADNGSTDGSREIGKRMGVRLVEVPQRGYGNAIREGMKVVTGKYIFTADSDDSYDFLEIPRFLEEIKKGYDFVQGCRLSSGGGKIIPGAMPELHKRIGNPFFSWLARFLFNVPIHDVYCGMKIFTRDIYNRLDLKSSSVQQAAETILRTSKLNAKFGELPITLYKDGRKVHPPHLKTFKDGWLTLTMFIKVYFDK